MKSRSLALLSTISLSLAACVAGPEPDPAPLVDAAQVSAAVRASLPLLQKSAAQWFEERSCTSCHHHSLGMMTVALAEERGFGGDRALFDAQVQLGIPTDPDSIEEVLQGDAGINGQLGQGYKLAALAVGKVGAGAHTDARAMFLLDMQGPDGHWRSVSHRPPLEDCDMTATALAARAMQLYPPPGNETRVAQAVESARRWLVQAAPVSNEERTMQLFGLAWTGADAKYIRKAVEGLSSEQRPDGGWAQLATRASDAYATGQALVALHQAGGLSVRSATYQRGLAFLLKDQLADGTWTLDTRRRGAGLPHFETGFPHGENQFIAYAASAWATMALTLGTQPGPSPILLGTAQLPRAAAPPDFVDPLTPLVRATLYGGIQEMRALLDAGADVNLAGKKGLTPLMAAVRDRDKTRLLLERGAQHEARSALGFSALILASGVRGGDAVVSLLLEKGADIRARANTGMNPLWQAVGSGNRELVELLLRSGAEVDARSGLDMSVLNLAVWQGDAAMVRTLLAHGADPNGLVPAGAEVATPLIAAVTDGFHEVVELLLAAGARVDAVDERGRTALAWAAVVDWGDDRTLSELLSRGASVEARDDEGASVLDHARKTGKASAVELVERHAVKGR